MSECVQSSNQHQLNLIFLLVIFFVFGQKANYKWRSYQGLEASCLLIVPTLCFFHVQLSEFQIPFHYQPPQLPIRIIF